MPKAFIIGNGGHAHVIASFLQDEPCFLTAEPKGEWEMAQAHFFDNIGSYKNAAIYIGIGDNLIRRQMFDRLKSLGVRVSTCIAPNAFIARDAVVAEGAVICAGAVIGSRAFIGPNAIVNTLSSVDHDCALGEDTQVTAGVTLGGTVRVGSNCFFGIKSAVIPNRTIGNDVQVMAGSLVTKDLPDGVMAGGVPARIVRGLEEGRQQDEDATAQGD